MRVQSAILCEHAAIVAGRLQILNALVTRWWPNEMPGTITPIVAGLIEADTDTGLQGKLTVQALNRADGRILATGSFDAVFEDPPDRFPGEPLLRPFIVQLTAAVAEPGMCDLTVALDGEIQARLPVAIVAPPN